MNNPYQEIDKLKQKQMLKIVSSSFYKELVKYGVDNSDIVSVSMNLLDYATVNGDSIDIKKDYFPFSIHDIQDDWNTKNVLGLSEITIKPLKKNEIETISGWLCKEETASSFIDLFPKKKNDLEKYLLNSSEKMYFSIYYQNKYFVGFIGGEKIDPVSKKIEMKKLIGDISFRGKGIGKSATFLFLYYIFNKLGFNKVYIHSMDTNIKNINLNSKFGFSLEGVLFSDVSLDGQYHDVIRLGLLKEKWSRIYNGLDKQNFIVE